MENIGSVLEALDPHLVCELSSEVKLHEKEIGKLEKQLLYFEKVLLLLFRNYNQPEMKKQRCLK